MECTAATRKVISRRHAHFWKTFNDWWRGELKKRGERPPAEEITQWYQANSENTWHPSIRPSLQETRVHAKCLRSVDAVRLYFRKYRAFKKGDCDSLSGADDAMITNEYDHQEELDHSAASYDQYPLKFLQKRKRSARQRPLNNSEPRRPNHQWNSVAPASSTQQDQLNLDADVMKAAALEQARFARHHQAGSTEGQPRQGKRLLSDCGEEAQPDANCCQALSDVHQPLHGWGTVMPVPSCDAVSSHLKTPASPMFLVDDDCFDAELDSILSGLTNISTPEHGSNLQCGAVPTDTTTPFSGAATSCHGHHRGGSMWGPQGSSQSRQSASVAAGLLPDVHPLVHSQAPQEVMKRWQAPSSTGPQLDVVCIHHWWAQDEHGPATLTSPAPWLDARQQSPTCVMLEHTEDAAFHASWGSFAEPTLQAPAFPMPNMSNHLHFMQQLQR